MCHTPTGKLRTTTRSIIAYKIVNLDYSSVLWSKKQSGRVFIGYSLQDYQPPLTPFYYRPDTTVRSPMPETPGIFLYREPYFWLPNTQTLRVRIPVGAAIQLGKDDAGVPAINASEICVLNHIPSPSGI